MRSHRNIFYLSLALLVFALLLSVGRLQAQVTPEFTYAILSGSTSQFRAPNSTTAPVLVSIGSAPTANITYPVNDTSGWNTTTLPAGWILTATPNGPYTWSSNSSTVNVTLTISIPVNATSATYAFPLRLTNGVDANNQTIAPGAGLTFTITVDNTPPVITPSVSPPPNSNGWNNGSVTVTWSVFDPESGIASSSGCNLTSLTTETAGTTLTCIATNQAGLPNSASVTIKIDLTSPSISGSRTPPANTFGWNNASVTVSFTCIDLLSGVGSLSGPTTLSSQGANQTVTGTCIDQAGILATATVIGINIDTTPPVISGSRSPPPNADGWNNVNVTVTFLCTDALSGVDTVSGPITVFTEGGNQTATGTCMDRASNQATTTITGINIDKTPPTITLSSRTPANSDGWNNNNVTITWSCSDSLSAPTVASLSQTITTEGAGQSATGICQDLAGNTGSDTQTGINIDKTPPAITGSQSPLPNSFGWTNQNVTVTFTCTDSLAGVSSSTVPTTLSSNGANQTVTGTCLDRAGNLASATIGGINIDKTPPTINFASRTPANSLGWNNNNVTITWSCGDTLSGPATASISQTVTTQGFNQTVTGTCTDRADNTGLNTQTGINIDKTPPLITGSRNPAANSFGWNNVNVTVSFSCSDTLSGLAIGSPPANTTLFADGSNQSVIGTCADKADNTASLTISDINIDKTTPGLNASRNPPANSFGWTNVTVTVTFSCTDILSGVASVTPPTNVTSEGVNQSVSGTCVDRAGNSASITLTGISIDRTAPTLVVSRNPPPNSNGWNNADVTVAFACADAGSGVDTITPTQTISTEGLNQAVTGVCSDRAGNTSSATILNINIDKTFPTLSASRNPPPNIFGWNNVNVTVTFVCSDNLSGVAAVSNPVTVSTEGSNQAVTGNCSDNASNQVSTTFTGINIDKTPPGITFVSRTPANSFGWNNSSFTATWSCTDTISAPVSPTITQSISTEGLNQSVTGTCQDLGTNTASNTQTGINIDLTPPTITGARNPLANSFGWNNGNVTVSFSCSDSLSGLAPGSPPPNATISTEGANLSNIGSCMDQAGNSASLTLSGINIDKTPPTLVGSRNPPPNADGWNSGDVTVSFACSDSLSGISTVSPPTILTVEGMGQSVTGSCSDRAENSASATIGSINIDKTAPAINASRNPPPNANGWNNGNVTITFSCTDALSGVASLTTPTIVSTEGANQAVTGICSDRAGNSALATVNVSIDKTPPTISASRNPVPNPNGWNNATVTVTFFCSDLLSGVSAVSGPVIVSTEGFNQTATGLCVDGASNLATTGFASINIDKTSPTITFVSRTPANSFGWNNGSFTATWSCADVLSGPISPTVTQSILMEGFNQTVTGMCQDRAGSIASDTLSGVNIDLTPPTIGGSRTPPPNSFGWNNVNVTVNFTCSDPLSGVGSLTGPTILSTEGANQAFTGVCLDRAGNQATATIGGINIDKTPPTLTGLRSPPPNANGWNNADVTVTFACSDNLSGTSTVSGPTALTSEGSGQAVTGSCSDNAGNSASLSVTGINIDKTVPTISSSRNPQPNANGWNNVNVTVTFTCTDTLAGVDSLTPPTIISTEGANQLVTGICTDRAGNSASSSASISIDKTAPTISASRNPAPNSAGWNNADVTVMYFCNDLLSGVSSVSSPATVSTEGFNQTVTGSCLDGASNQAATSFADINIDKTSPSIAFVSRTPANSFGWNNGSFTAIWSCTDLLSGPLTPTVTQSLLTEGFNQTVIGVCHDRASNTVSNTLTGINIDLTPPAVTGSRSPPANSFGWNNANVTVSFTCTDSLSGVGSLTSPTVLSTEGANQAVTGICLDRASNQAMVTFGGINIDRTSPTLTGFSNPQPNPFGWNNANVTVSFFCSEILSGIDTFSAPTTLTAEGANQAVTGSCIDRAGNSVNTTIAGINIDKTAPSITASLNPPPNANGWNNADVTVTYTCTDILSGVESVTSPATLTTEGANQSATGTCADRAGNNAATTTSNISIDRTPPTITASRSPAPNANGWNNVNVTVTFLCSDLLSGLGSVSSPVTVSTEGANQTASGTCIDMASNQATTSLTGINLDQTLPTITFLSRTPANSFGWNNGSFTATWSCADLLSGPLNPTISQSISTEGLNQTVTGTCEDQASNIASDTQVGINIDLTPPAITGSQNPPPNSFGWSNANVTVSFACTDALSGLAPGSPPPDTILTTEGLNILASGTCTDRAGNEVSLNVSVNIDRTPPTLTSSRGPAPNTDGWNNVDVTVTFLCSDILSGVDAVSAPITLDHEGANQTATGSCNDNAGNSADATITDINIDKTPPGISFLERTPPNSNGWNNQDVTLNWSCSDSLSGPQSSPITNSLTTEGTNQTATGTCLDRAGNTASDTQTSINIDKTPPTAAITLSPSIPDGLNGWYHTDVTISFQCTDSLSGLDPSTVCPADLTITTDGIHAITTGIVSDQAGNSASFSITVKRNTSLPSVILAPDRIPDQNNWYNRTVTFTANASSIITGGATCTPISSYSGPDRANAAITTTCTDLSGNSVTATFYFNYDSTAPDIQIASPVQGRVYKQNERVSTSFSCGDDGSGILRCQGMVASGAELDTSGVGAVIFSVTATDQAGNSITRYTYYWVTPQFPTLPPYLTLLTIAPAIAAISFYLKRKRVTSALNVQFFRTPH